ncbi:MAG: amidohydrolase [Gemmatimonadaceae bacterium]
MRTSLVITTLLLATGCNAPARRGDADRIVINAKVWTGDTTRPAVEALAIRHGRIIAVGSSEEMRLLAGDSTIVTDAGGRRVLPGFNDAHWHLPAREDAQLQDAGSVEEIVRRLSTYAATLGADAWVVGRGWSPSDFPGNQAHRKYLDQRFPDRPVALRDRDGHQLLVNTRALALAGITAATPDPARGQIDRDRSGAPTGLLKESATKLVQDLIPPPTAEQVRAGLQREMQRAASFGLTSLQEASGGEPSGASFAAFRQAEAEGTMLVRLRASVPFERQPTPERLAEFVALRDAYRGSLLRFGIAKGYLDGTVDAKTAYMLEPYVGGGRGLPFWTQPALDEAVAAYDKAGLQVALHAIGDGAVRMALDAFEHAMTINGTSGKRHRIEHIEVPARADLPRFNHLGVIASTQAIFAGPDASTLQNYAPLLGPERSSRANAFRLFDDAHAVQAFGSDYPVFPMNVLTGIYAAVTREMPDGTPAGGWYPENRISVEAALRHYTRDAAFAEFAEGEKGVLAPGMMADFVVLSEDVLEGPPSRLLRATVLLTVMGGRETYRRESFR